MKKLIRNLLLTSLLLLGAAAQAADCASCADLEKATRAFRALNPRSSVDQETGGKRIEATLALVRAGLREAAKNAKHKTQILARVFDLVSAAGPFDFESQGAQVLHEGLRRDRQAAAQFDREFGGNKLSCEKKLLKSSILEFRCDDRKSGGKIPAEGGSVSCVQTFNYDLCK